MIARHGSLMTQRDEFVEVQFTDGVKLRTAFAWRVDRYAHAVTLVEPAGEHTLIESMEGNPDDPWPPSPAFQQLSMQGEGEQRVALLVGMAGKSHWSMSVEVSGDRRGIVFDVACRVNESAESLGSWYRTNGLAMVDQRTTAGQIDTRRYALSLDSTLPLESQSLSTSDNQLRIDSVATHSPPCTARWKYALTLV